MIYKKLIEEQGYQIYAFMKPGFTQKQIAAEISVHPSTISRKLRRRIGASAAIALVKLSIAG